VSTGRHCRIDLYGIKGAPSARNGPVGGAGAPSSPLNAVTLVAPKGLRLPDRDRRALVGERARRPST